MRSSQPSRYQHQPQVQAFIDRTHPSTAQIKSAIYPGDNFTFCDSVTGKIWQDPYPEGSFSVKSFSAQGRGRATNGGSYRCFLNWTPDTTTGYQTIIAIVRPRVSVASGTVQMGYAGDTTAGWTLGGFNLSAGNYFAGFCANGGNLSSDAPYNIGECYSLAYTNDGWIGVQNFYVNGLKQAASGTFNGNAGKACNGALIGETGVSQCFDILGFFVWSRVLAPSEIKELSKNPWQLFRKNTTRDPLGIYAVSFGTGPTNYPVSLSDTGAATDSSSATVIFAGTVSEIVSGFSNTSAINTTSGAYSDSLSATTANNGVTSFTAADVETSAVTDSGSALSVGVATMVESGNAVESVSFSAQNVVSILESLAVTEGLGASSSYQAVAIDSSVVTETIGVLGTLNAVTAEAVAVTSQTAVGATAYLLDTNETLAITEVIAAVSAQAAARWDTGAAVEVVSGAQVANAGRFDNVVLIEVPSALWQTSAGRSDSLSAIAIQTVNTVYIVTAASVPSTRWITFAGNSRVVKFEGNSRVVGFEGNARVVAFQGNKRTVRF